jgi:hypothetical protein
MSLRVTGSFRVLSMGGAAFNLLKTRQTGTKSADDAEGGLAELPKSLSVL